MTNNRWMRGHQRINSEAPFNNSFMRIRVSVLTTHLGLTANNCYSPGSAYNTQFLGKMKDPRPHKIRSMKTKEKCAFHLAASPKEALDGRQIKGQGVATRCVVSYVRSGW